jgi:hypothetical protein
MGKALFDTFLASYDRPPKAILLDIDGEHSAILTSHRGPLYNGCKLFSTSFERTHPWDVLRLSP